VVIIDVLMDKDFCDQNTESVIKDKTEGYFSEDDGRDFVVLSYSKEEFDENQVDKKEKKKQRK
jgi:hypothetical protein